MKSNCVFIMIVTVDGQRKMTVYFSKMVTPSRQILQDGQTIIGHSKDSLFLQDGYTITADSPRWSNHHRAFQSTRVSRKSCRLHFVNVKVSNLKKTILFHLRKWPSTRKFRPTTKVASETSDWNKLNKTTRYVSVV